MATGQKTKNILTRAQMVKNIKERLLDEKDIKLSKEEISAVLSIEEDEIYACIAKCQQYQTVWGVIMGTISPPKRIGGTFRELEAVRKRHGWSNYKYGVPKIRWSRACKVCENHDPSEYFEMDEHRYTTQARTYRKDCGLPEIPEYADLDEEKIKALCLKADDLELADLTAQERYNKKRDRKFNDEKKRATIDYWKKTGYIPTGALYSESLGEDNYTGKQYDTVDHFLKDKLDDKFIASQKYNYVLNAKEIAIKKETFDNHPELDELLNKYKKEIEEQKLEYLPYTSTWHERDTVNLRYCKEINPWGIVFEDVDNYQIPKHILEKTGYSLKDYQEMVKEEKLKGEEQVETE